jgi:hypothetical protein
MGALSRWKQQNLLLQREEIGILIQGVPTRTPLLRFQQGPMG